MREDFSHLSLVSPSRLSFNSSSHHLHHLRLRSKLRREHLWIGAGEDGLIRAVDLIEQEAAPFGVEFGHHFVQQQNGPVVDLRAHPVRFRQLQRQNGRALLPARSVNPQIDFIGDEAQFVAMRPDQRACRALIPRCVWP